MAFFFISPFKRAFRQQFWRNATTQTVKNVTALIAETECVVKAARAAISEIHNNYDFITNCHNGI